MLRFAKKTIVMTKEEAIDLEEKSQWLVGKIVGGLKVSSIGVIPIGEHPNRGDILRCIFENKNHWHLMNGVADFEVRAFFSDKFINNGIGGSMDIFEAQQKVGT